MKNIYLYLAILCLTSLAVLKVDTINHGTSDDDKKAIVGAAIVCSIFLLVAWVFSKEATVCVGADPGGASHAMGNPFGASPFWVNFKTVGNDSVDSII